jgi:hypothetical protein
MLVEQDGFYLNAMGEIVHIEIRGDGIPFDEAGMKYTLDGEYCSVPSPYDLIGYIPKELHYGILQKIDNYHKSNSYKKIVNMEFEKDINV